MKIFLKIFGLLILLNFFLPAKAIIPVVDFDALIQMGLQLSQLEKQTEYIATELNHLSDSQYQWGNAQGLINNLGAVIQETNGLAYSASNVDGQFKQAYPGYKPPQDFSQQYKQNTEMTLNTLNGVLQSMGTSAQDFQNENQRLRFLQQQSQNAQGQTQAVQASAQIASEMVTQIQLLRQTMIAQTNAQTAYYATQTQNEASARAELENVMSAGSTTVPAYGTSGHSLHIPEY